MRLVKFRRSLSITLVAIALMFGLIIRPALAGITEVSLEIPVYGQVSSDSYEDLLAQSESLVRRAIAERFAENPGLSELKVSVLGRRSGEVVPILAATVTRDRWQADPELTSEIQYYPAFALLQRRNAPVIARGAASSGQTVAALPNDRRAIDRALDDGKLSGSAAQRNLNEID